MLSGFGKVSAKFAYKKSDYVSDVFIRKNMSPSENEETEDCNLDYTLTIKQTYSMNYVPILAFYSIQTFM
jgi:hypothetical protein